MHVTDWAKAQKEDPVLMAVLDWLEVQKRMDLRMLLAECASSEEGRLILWNWHNFMIHQKALYLCSTPKGESEDLLLFMAPKAHQVATLNGCRMSGPWPYSIPITGMLLVARDGQSVAASHQDLHALLTTWGQFVQGSFTPYHGHHSPGSLTYRIYQHRDNLGAEEVT